MNKVWSELVKQQIADFSGQLNLQELYSYIFEVKESIEKNIKSLSYVELTQKISEACLRIKNKIHS